MRSESTPRGHSDANADATLVGTHDSRATGGAPPAQVQIARGDAIGRYIAVQPIGRGANGQVWSAYDSDLDRKVAIKLLAQSVDASADRRRVQLTEAQAMAKIRHPNVVAVYDVGTHHGHLYIAMEFVEGATLGAWAREARRTQAELLDAYTAAARGLAAAHSAGLVHRDFKPDNVLVDREGRARVADFGLAAPVTTSDASHATSGTPAYMSPEHHVGKVDAKSDQFSFCVALCEALTGLRPFVGATLAELAAATVSATIDPRALAPLPARVRGVVLRGLAPLPANRHASMDALVDALQRARRPRWPWLVGAVTVASLVGVTWSLAGPARERDACSGGAERTDAVWTTKDRTRIRVGAGEYSASYAESVGEHLGAQLDEYATLWAAVHDRVCTATQSTAPATEPTKIARRACVEDRFATFAGAAALVTTRELEVDAIDPLLGALRDPAECERDDIAAWEPVPAEPRLATEVAAIRTRLHEVSLRFLAGEIEAAEADSYAALADARATGYPHLVASALVEVAGFDDTLGHTDTARKHLDEATEIALTAGLDWLVATIAIERLEHRSRYPSDDHGGEEWGLVARALIARSGGDDRLVGRLHGAQAGIAYNRGDFASALAHHRASIAAYESMAVPPRRRLGSSYLEAAITAAQLNRPAEARELVAGSQRMIEGTGDRRPLDIVRAQHLSGTLESALGRPRAALEHYSAALDLSVATYGRASRMTSIVAFNQTLTLADCGRIAEARESLALSRDAWPASSDEYAAAEFQMAEYAIDLHAGDGASALVHVERAIEIWSANTEANARAIVNAQRNRARTLLVLGDNDGVLAALEPLYRRWGPETFVGPESVLDAVLAARAKQDHAAVALWLARSEAHVDAEGPGVGLHTFLRALASAQPDAATIASVRGVRERFAATHFDGHLRVKQMDAWLAEVSRR